MENKTLIGILTSVLLAIGTATPVVGQVLTNQTIDLVLQDDDPGYIFIFNLAPDPDVASVIDFNGSFQNLSPTQTGVRYTLTWTQPSGAFGGSLGTDWTPLPASGQLPVQFNQAVPFTPAAVELHIEGGGPTDHFRFSGDFSVAQVPEPTALGVLGAGLLLGLCVRRLGLGNLGAR